MKKFKDIDDVELWMDSLDYEGFWHAINPLDLVVQPKDHCDQQIASGVVDEETVLDVIKSLACMELTKAQGLKRRPARPWLKLVETH